MRYTVIECLQPGFGPEKWEPVGNFDNLKDAIYFAERAPSFYARDVFDNETEKCVHTGWRCNEE